MALRPWTDHLPTGIGEHDVDLGAGRSLVDSWSARWADDAARPVLVDGTAVVTAAEFEDRSRLAARRLDGAGVGPGDRVVLSARTSIDFVIAHVGALRLGCTVVPVNAAYRQPEVAHVVADAGVSAAIVDDKTRAEWIRELAPDATVTDPSLHGLAPAAGEIGIDAAGPDDPALLVYTSGTTGAPKGVPLTHANLLTSAEAVRLAWRWEPDDRLVLALPLFHMHGLGVGLHGTLTAGATAHLLDAFEPAAVVDAVTAGATMFFAVPTMWHRLAADPGAGGLAGLRLGVSGSAPLAPDLHARIAAVTGRAPLERYGMSETVMLVSNPYDGERRPGSVGFPLPGVEVRLSATTEIEVGGPNVFAGYRNQPQATASAFDGRWFRTGDLGEVDDGYLRISGRAKELIITGGYNVHPREVEDVLAAHPAVDDAAVVGTPDGEWGEVVCAFVVLADDVSFTDLEAWCRDRLAPYKLPRRWETVEVVPRNALGKITRNVLEEWAARS